MASWTDQSVDSLLPGEPWTSAKALAAFENPVALAEDASGAPKIYRRLRHGSATGGNIDFSGLADYGGIEFHAAIYEDTGIDPATMDLQYSTNNGSTYTTAVEILDVLETKRDGFAYGYFDFETGELSFVRNDSSTNPGATVTVSGAPLAVTDIRFVVSTGDRGHVIIKAIGGVS